MNEPARKLIIAGGRDLSLKQLSSENVLKIVEIICTNKYEIIVSGKCSGADKIGEEIAAHMKIPVVPFPADWNKHGKAAGPLRNADMAEYADGVILLPVEEKGQPQ